MDNEKECKWLEQFQELKRIYDLREEELDNVTYDCELIQAGWKIIHAIDFNLIYEFASFAGIKPEKQFEDEVIDCARAFVFSKIGEIEIPMLLPPFMVELRDHLSFILSLQKKLINISERGENEEDQALGYQDLLTDEENHLIIKANEWYDACGDSESLPSEIMDPLIKIIEAKFFDLYNLLSGRVQEEARKMARLVKEKRIQYPADLFGEKSEIMDLINRVMDYNIDKIPWYKKFREIRPDFSKTISNVHDAKAIEIVLCLNEHFKKKGEKEIIFLLSDAKSMKNVLNMDIDDNIPAGSFLPLGCNRETGVLRTSKAFLTYMLNEGENIEETLKNLYEEKERINEFRALETILKYASTECNLECQKGMTRKFSCQNAEKELKEHIKSYEKVFVSKIIEKRQKLFGVQSIDKSQTDYNPYIRDFVTFLLEERPDFESRIREETKKLQSEMDIVFESIQNNLISLIGFISLEKLTYKIQRLLGIPYKIYFKEESIDRAIGDLFESIEIARKNRNEKNIQEVRNKLNSLLSLTKDVSLGSKRNLLLVTLFFCHKYYPLARELACEQLLSEQTDSEVRREFLLLEGLSCIRLYDRKKYKKYLRRVEEICMEAENSWKSDPRFENLRGIVNLRLGKYRESVEHFENAMNKLEEFEADSNDKKALRSVLLNNQIYGLCKSTVPQVNEILQAQKLVEDLKKEWPESKWDLQFLDTNGFLLLREAEFAEKTSVKRELLKKAENKFKKALKLAKEYDLDESEMRIMEDHLKLCENMISQTSIS